MAKKKRRPTSDAILVGVNREQLAAKMMCYEFYGYVGLKNGKNNDDISRLNRFKFDPCKTINVDILKQQVYVSAGFMPERWKIKKHEE